jgi:hypothetical protein
MEWGVVTTRATMRIAVGLMDAINTLAGDPSAFLNCIMMAADAGDTNMQIMQNTSAGTCTKTDLGASFPKTANVVYLFVLTAAANSSSVTYSVTRLDSAATATGTLSTNLPINTILMGTMYAFGNGGTAAAAAGCFFRTLSEQ